MHLAVKIGPERFEQIACEPPQKPLKTNGGPGINKHKLRTIIVNLMLNHGLNEDH